MQSVLFSVANKLLYCDFLVSQNSKLFWSAQKGSQHHKIHDLQGIMLDPKKHTGEIFTKHIGKNYISVPDSMLILMANFVLWGS